MTQKCVHKGCGKKFTDPDEDCVFHPLPPIFHEGQKGWKCCKPRVLTFDEFLSIHPCTTGKHSTTDDTPAPEEPPPSSDTDANPVPAPKPISTTIGSLVPAESVRPIQPAQPSVTSSPPPESESDDPSISIAPNTTCRRRSCNASSPSHTTSLSRDSEECVFHPGHPIFHEGSKGWTCCKRRVLDFDEFMRIEGCKKKDRHLFVGNGKKGEKEEEEILQDVRHDFYQTSTTVIASLYLKKINKDRAKVEFISSVTVSLDLPTTENKRYKAAIPLFGPIDTEKSTYKIMGTKLELTLLKADGIGWPVLRSDQNTNEIIQVGRAGRA